MNWISSKYAPIKVMRLPVYFSISTLSLLLVSYVLVAYRWCADAVHAPWSTNCDYCMLLHLLYYSGIMHPKMADYALIMQRLFLRRFWYMTSAADTRGAWLPTETPIYAC